MKTVKDFKAVMVQPYGGFPLGDEYVIDIWTAVVVGESEHMYYIFGTEEFGQFAVSRDDINGPNIFKCDTFGQVIEQLARGEGSTAWLQSLRREKETLETETGLFPRSEDYAYYVHQLEVINEAIASLEKGGK